MAIVPVLMSGGSGTRLWPVSRRVGPKQLKRVVGDVTMIQATVRRLDGVADIEPPIVVAGEAHVTEIRSQLTTSGRQPRLTFAEPVGRNTAPAVALAAGACSPEDLMVVLPSDHVITDEPAFRSALELALAAAGTGRLVTFGVVPTRPATGYGYIRASGPGAVESVVEFVEKPDSETAERYVASGAYLWNSGMFVFPVGLLLDEMHRFCPDVIEAVRSAVETGTEEGGVVRPSECFADVRSVSIDNAVMEHTDRATVVGLDAGWTDVGSWDAVWEVETKDTDGNVIEGDAVTHEVIDSLVRAESRAVAVIGLSGVVVVETEDAVLVVSKDRSQDVKAIVERLNAEGRSDLT